MLCPQHDNNAKCNRVSTPLVEWEAMGIANLSCSYCNNDNRVIPSISSFLGGSLLGTGEECVQNKQASKTPKMQLPKNILSQTLVKLLLYYRS